MTEHFPWDCRNAHGYQQCNLIAPLRSSFRVCTDETDMGYGVRIGLETSNFMAEMWRRRHVEKTVFSLSRQ